MIDKQINDEMEKMREELNCNVIKQSLTDRATIDISQKLDKCINNYYKMVMTK